MIQLEAARVLKGAEHSETSPHECDVVLPGSGDGLSQAGRATGHSQPKVPMALLIRRMGTSEGDNREAGKGIKQDRKEGQHLKRPATESIF